MIYDYISFFLSSMFSFFFFYIANNTDFVALDYHVL